MTKLGGEVTLAAMGTLPNGGKVIEERGGGVVVRKNLCIQCGGCVAACPVDAICQDRHGDVYVCIHCGRCVDFCPHNCLAMVEVVGVTEELP